MRTKNGRKRTMPNAAIFTQEALRFLAEPAGGMQLKAQDNKLARLLNLTPERVRKLRKGYRKPTGDELFTILLRVREMQDRASERRALLDDMERKIAAVLPSEDGALAGPLVRMARRAGDEDCGS